MINIAVHTHTSSFSLVTPSTHAATLTPRGGGPLSHRCYAGAPDFGSQLYYFYFFSAFSPAACSPAACSSGAFSPAACSPAACLSAACPFCSLPFNSLLSSDSTAVLQPHPQHIVVGCCCLLPAACTRHSYRWCCSHLLEQSGCFNLAAVIPLLMSGDRPHLLLSLTQQL